MNRVLINLYVPAIEKEYDVWIPLNKKVYNVIILIIKGLRDENYIPQNMPLLYNKITGQCYKTDVNIQDTDIRNATELILV